jgi:hypothetical protein
MSRVSVGRLAPVEGLFTSESVADGHPDKIADQLSDAVLDAALRQDPQARVAVEAAIKGSAVWLFGELTGRDLSLDFPEIGGVRTERRRCGRRRWFHGAAPASSRVQMSAFQHIAFAWSEGSRLPQTLRFQAMEGG